MSNLPVIVRGFSKQERNALAQLSIVGDNGKPTGVVTAAYVGTGSTKKLVYFAEFAKLNKKFIFAFIKNATGTGFVWVKGGNNTSNDLANPPITSGSIVSMKAKTYSNPTKVELIYIQKIRGVSHLRRSYINFFDLNATPPTFLKDTTKNTTSRNSDKTLKFIQREGVSGSPNLSDQQDPKGFTVEDTSTYVIDKAGRKIYIYKSDPSVTNSLKSFAATEQSKNPSGSNYMGRWDLSESPVHIGGAEVESDYLVFSRTPSVRGDSSGNSENITDADWFSTTDSILIEHTDEEGSKTLYPGGAPAVVSGVETGDLVDPTFTALNWDVGNGTDVGKARWDDSPPMTTTHTITTGGVSYTAQATWNNGAASASHYANGFNGIVCWNRNFTLTGTSPTNADNPSGTIWRLRATGVTGANATSAATGITGTASGSTLGSGGHGGYQACLNFGTSQWNAAFGSAHTGSSSNYTNAVWHLEKQSDTTTTTTITLPEDSVLWNAGTGAATMTAIYQSSGVLAVNDTSLGGTFPTDTTSGLWRIRRLDNSAMTGFGTLTSVQGSGFKTIHVGTQAEMQTAFGNSQLTTGSAWVLEKKQVNGFTFQSAKSGSLDDIAVGSADTYRLTLTRPNTPDISAEGQILAGDTDIASTTTQKYFRIKKGTTDETELAFGTGIKIDTPTTGTWKLERIVVATPTRIPSGNNYLGRWNVNNTVSVNGTSGVAKLRNNPYRDVEFNKTPHISGSRLGGNGVVNSDEWFNQGDLVTIIHTPTNSSVQQIFTGTCTSSGSTAGGMGFSVKFITSPHNVSGVPNDPPDNISSGTFDLWFGNHIYATVNTSPIVKVKYSTQPVPTTLDKGTLDKGTLDVWRIPAGTITDSNRATYNINSTPETYYELLTLTKRYETSPVGVFDLTGYGNTRPRDLWVHEEGGRKSLAVLDDGKNKVFSYTLEDNGSIINKKLTGTFVSGTYQIKDGDPDYIPDANLRLNTLVEMRAFRDLLAAETTDEGIIKAIEKRCKPSVGRYVGVKVKPTASLSEFTSDNLLITTPGDGYISTPTTDPTIEGATSLLVLINKRYGPLPTIEYRDEGGFDYFPTYEHIYGVSKTDTDEILIQNTDYKGDTNSSGVKEFDLFSTEERTSTAFYTPDKLSGIITGTTSEIVPIIDSSPDYGMSVKTVDENAENLQNLIQVSIPGATTESDIIAAINRRYNFNFTVPSGKTFQKLVIIKNQVSTLKADLSALSINATTENDFREIVKDNCKLLVTDTTPNFSEKFGNDVVFDSYTNKFYLVKDGNTNTTVGVSNFYNYDPINKTYTYLEDIALRYTPAVLSYSTGLNSDVDRKVCYSMDGGKHYAGFYHTEAGVAKYRIVQYNVNGTYSEISDEILPPASVNNDYGQLSITSFSIIGNYIFHRQSNKSIICATINPDSFGTAFTSHVILPEDVTKFSTNDFITTSKTAKGDLLWVLKDADGDSPPELHSFLIKEGFPRDRVIPLSAEHTATSIKSFAVSDEGDVLVYDVDGTNKEIFHYNIRELKPGFNLRVGKDNKLYASGKFNPKFENLSDTPVAGAGAFVRDGGDLRFIPPPTGSGDHSLTYNPQSRYTWQPAASNQNVGSVIRDRLQSLTGEERLDSTAVKNLPGLQGENALTVRIDQESGSASGHIATSTPATGLTATADTTINLFTESRSRTLDYWDFVQVNFVEGTAYSGFITIPKNSLTSGTGGNLVSGLGNSLYYKTFDDRKVQIKRGSDSSLLFRVNTLTPTSDRIKIKSIYGVKTGYAGYAPPPAYAVNAFSSPLPRWNNNIDNFKHNDFGFRYYLLEGNPDGDKPSGHTNIGGYVLSVAKDSQSTNSYIQTLTKYDGGGGIWTRDSNGDGWNDWKFPSIETDNIGLLNAPSSWQLLVQGTDSSPSGLATYYKASDSATVSANASVVATTGLTIPSNLNGVIFTDLDKAVPAQPDADKAGRVEFYRVYLLTKRVDDGNVIGRKLIHFNDIGTPPALSDSDINRAYQYLAAFNLDGVTGTERGNDAVEALLKVSITTSGLLEQTITFNTLIGSNYESNTWNRITNIQTVGGVRLAGDRSGWKEVFNGVSSAPENDTTTPYGSGLEGTTRSDASGVGLKIDPELQRRIKQHDNKIGTGATGQILNVDLADDIISQPKMQDDSIGTDEIIDGSVNLDKLDSNNIISVDTKNITAVAANINTTGIWSDGTTMWAVDAADDKVYAYTLDTGLQDTDKEFGLAAGNTNASGIWAIADKTKAWVANSTDNRLYGYNLSDRTRLPSGVNGIDITLESGDEPRGVWGDGTTLYVAVRKTGAMKIKAFTISTKGANIPLDIPLHSTNTTPTTMFGDASTIWVMNGEAPRKVFAYNRFTKLRDESAEFDVTSTAYAIWGNGQNIWIGDHGTRNIKAYTYPTVAGSVLVLNAEGEVERRNRIERYNPLKKYIRGDIVVTEPAVGSDKLWVLTRDVDVDDTIGITNAYELSTNSGLGVGLSGSSTPDGLDYAEAKTVWGNNLNNFIAPVDGIYFYKVDDNADATGIPTGFRTIPVFIKVERNGPHITQTITGVVNNELKVYGRGGINNSYSTPWIDFTQTGGSGEVNVQADWSITDNNSDAFIKNKPDPQTATEIKNKLGTLTGDDRLDAVHIKNIISTVSTDATITGDGTSNNPLVVANPFTDDDETKLDGIETSATADQTPAELVTALGTLNGDNRLDAMHIKNIPEPPDGGLASVASDETLTGLGTNADKLKVANPFTDADETKLDNIAPGATVGATTDQANAIAANTAKTGITQSQADAITANTAKRTYPQADETKLGTVEENATADQTGTEMVAALEDLTGDARLSSEAVVDIIRMRGTYDTTATDYEFGDLVNHTISTQKRYFLCVAVTTSANTITITNGVLHSDWREFDNPRSLVSVTLVGNVMTFRNRANATITINLPTTNALTDNTSIEGDGTNNNKIRIKAGGISSTHIGSGQVGNGNLALSAVTRNIINTPTPGSADQVLTRSNEGSGLKWATPMTSSGGITTVETDATITGTGVSGDPLIVANPFTDGDETKLDAIENNATADQTSAEIRDGLASLTGADRIPATAIKDLPSGGLATVASNATITGDGSGGNPLAVANPFTDEDETKLDAIAENATADQTPEQIVTGLETLTGENRVDASAIKNLPQPSGGGLTSVSTNSTISGLGTPESVLSVANPFTSADKTKLDNIETGAEVNVKPNWTEADNTSDSYIQNKPTIPAAGAQLSTDSQFETGTSTILAPQVVQVSKAIAANAGILAQWNGTTNPATEVQVGTLPTVTAGSLNTTPYDANNDRFIISKSDGSETTNEQRLNKQSRIEWENDLIDWKRTAFCFDVEQAAGNWQLITYFGTNASPININQDSSTNGFGIGTFRVSHPDADSYLFAVTPYIGGTMTGGELTPASYFNGAAAPTNTNIGSSLGGFNGFVITETTPRMNILVVRNECLIKFYVNQILRAEFKLTDTQNNRATGSRFGFFGDGGNSKQVYLYGLAIGNPPLNILNPNYDPEQVIHTDSTLDGDGKIERPFGIADDAVETVHIAPIAVTGPKIATAAVSTSKVAPLAITTGKIGGIAVTEAKVAPDAISKSKIKTTNTGTAGQVLAIASDGESLEWVDMDATHIRGQLIPPLPTN